MRSLCPLEVDCLCELIDCLLVLKPEAPKSRLGASICAERGQKYKGLGLYTIRRRSFTHEATGLRRWLATLFV